MLVHQQQQQSYLLSELSDRSFSSDEWLTIGVALRETSDPEASEASQDHLIQQVSPPSEHADLTFSSDAWLTIGVTLQETFTPEA